MRGVPSPHRRAGAKPQPVNEANASAFTLPAPYGGWNASGNLSNMPPLDAVIMDNIFPGVTDVSLRKGSASFATGLPADARKLMNYSSSASKLFVSTATAVYDISAGGAVGAAAFSCTSGEWSFTNFSNTGGNYLVMVNGADSMEVYNGTTWTAINGASTPALTGVATSNLVQVISHKHRLWFVEQNTMNLWYLAIDAFAGAATRFPVGALFAKGGTVAYIATWTITNGNGSDDYFVILTTNGELAVYAGTDPASSSTWALVGVYFVGRPMGKQPLIKYGGDLLLLTDNGLLPLSSFAQSVVVDRSKLVSDKIRGAFLDYAQAFKALNDWQMTLYPTGNFLLVNAPLGGGQSHQFVMNLTTKAWCRFTGWNSTCFLEKDGNLYFTSGTGVFQAWAGLSDNGVPITGTVQQSYNALRYSGTKVVSLVKPHLVISKALTVSYYIDTDFRDYGGGSQISYITPFGVGLWDESHWDGAYWSSGVFPLTPSWLTVPNQLGYLHSIRLQVISSTSEVAWTATQFLYRPAGLL